MVGHSQLESDMLEESPPPMAAADAEDDSVAEPAHAAAAHEAPMAQDNTGDETDAGNSVDEGVQDVHKSPAPRAAPQDSPMPVPQPGRKRKRSGLGRGDRQAAALVGPCHCNIFPSLAAPM